MKSLIAFLAVLLISSGCAHMLATYSVERQYDEFDKRTSIYMKNNWLDGYEGFASVSLALNVVKQTDPSGEKWFAMIHYQSDNWLFIRAGESLVMLIDGEKLTLSCSEPSRNVLDAGNSTRNVTGRGMCAEMATYPVERATMSRIAGAKEVKVKVIGGEHYIDGAFSKDNFARLKLFVSQ